MSCFVIQSDQLTPLLVPDHRGFRVQRDEVLLRQRAGLPHRRPLPHPPHLAVGHQAQLSLREGPTEGRNQNFAEGMCMMHDVHIGNRFIFEVSL